MTLKNGVCFRLGNPVTTPQSADVFVRQRDLRYRTIKLQFLRRRYARLKQNEHHSRIWRRRHLLYPLIQHQRWLATLSLGETADSIAWSALTANGIDMGTFEDPSGTSRQAIVLPVIEDGGFTALPSSLPINDEKGALEFSGGSTAATNKITLDADGGLQLYFAPSWSFIAKFDGEIRPQPQLYAGTGALHHTW